MGNIEFKYVLKQLKGPCFFVLDDINHVKHFRSFQEIQADDRFEILDTSNEKFGFCIAKFSPSDINGVDEVVSASVEPNTSSDDDVSRHLMWLRTDSIGDNVLAASMLHYVRQRFKHNRITVVCQDKVAELYETCPFIDEIFTFNYRRLCNDVTYRNDIIDKIRLLKVDCVLNSVYSRDGVNELLATSAQASELIGLDGDLCNISQEQLENNRCAYTQLIPSEGEWKHELERHKDFLLGLNIPVNQLHPVVWTNENDGDTTTSLLALHGYDPSRTIIMFAGARSELRVYNYYGEALAQVCNESDYGVIAVGVADEFELNQKQLDKIGVKTLNLCGKLTIRQLSALVSKCALTVGAETGTAHLACAVGTPNVVLIGGGHFGRFMPYSPLTTLVCLPLECFHCNWRCRYSRTYCIKDVNPAVLAVAIRSALEGPSETADIYMQAEHSWEQTPDKPRWDSTKIVSNAVPIKRIMVGPKKESSNNDNLRLWLQMQDEDNFDYPTTIERRSEMNLPKLPVISENVINNFYTNTNWGISDPAKFASLMSEAAKLVTPGYYFGDNFFTWGRNNSLFEDPAFVKAWQSNIQNTADQAIAWRRYILACAAYHCIQLKGDFVECGVYNGSGMKTVIDYIGVTEFKSTFWGYDTFDYHPVAGHAFEGQTEGFFENVQKRFEGYSQVKLVQGLLPESLHKNSPKKISFLHLDLNSAEYEIKVLDSLFDRVVAGGMVILDDYEWSGIYRVQKIAEDAWFEKRNYRVFPLPTGQGFVLKR